MGALSVPSRRVGEFLGSLLRVALGLPLPPITVTSECTVSAVSFSPLADRSRRNVAFWRSSLATLAVPVVRRPVSRVRPRVHSVRPRGVVPSGVVAHSVHPRVWWPLARLIQFVLSVWWPLAWDIQFVLSSCCLLCRTMPISKIQTNLWFLPHTLIVFNRLVCLVLFF